MLLFGADTWVLLAAIEKTLERVHVGFLMQVRSRCRDLFGIHMPEGQLIKYHRKKRCNRNTQMRWRRRDISIASWCAEASFSITGKYKAECI